MTAFLSRCTLGWEAGLYILSKGGGWIQRVWKTETSIYEKDSHRKGTDE